MPSRRARPPPSAPRQPAPEPSRRAASRDRERASRRRIRREGGEDRRRASIELYAMISSMEQQLRALASRVRAARAITVMTGAGVSAASGVPTFRGPDGLWRTFRPEDLATPDAFARDPALVWEWYSWRRAKAASCRPNAAHEVIARWSQDPSRQVRVITQNVDDLHLRAGTRNLIRLHGSLWETKCFNGCAAGAHAWRDEELAE